MKGFHFDFFLRYDKIEGKGDELNEMKEFSFPRDFYSLQVVEVYFLKSWRTMSLPNV